MAYTIYIYTIQFPFIHSSFIDKFWSFCQFFDGKLGILDFLLLPFLQHNLHKQPSGGKVRRAFLAKFWLIFDQFLAIYFKPDYPNKLSISSLPLPHSISTLNLPIFVPIPSAFPPFLSAVFYIRPASEFSNKCNY